MWDENWKTDGWIGEDKSLGEIILVLWMKEKVETALEKKKFSLHGRSHHQ